MLKHIERAAEFRARALQATEAANATQLPMVRDRLARAAASWEALAEAEDLAIRGKVARLPPVADDLETKAA